MTVLSRAFETGGINNMNFYSSEAVDSAVRALQTEFDAEKQITLQQDIDKALWDDFYGVTIFQFPEVTAFSDRVTNIDPSILAPTIFWNAWDWEVTDGGTAE